MNLNLNVEQKNIYNDFIMGAGLFINIQEYHQFSHFQGVFIFLEDITIIGLIKIFKYRFAK